MMIDMKLGFAFGLLPPTETRKIFFAGVRVVKLEVIMNNRITITEPRPERHLLPDVCRTTGQAKADILNSVALTCFRCLDWYINLLCSDQD